MRRSALALTTVGIGVGLVYAAGRARAKNKQRREPKVRGTDQDEALELLAKIKAENFESSDEKLALALGRPVDEVQAWTRGEQPVDSDVLMKARALALERGVDTEA